MFEIAELGHCVDKEDYKKAVSVLRTQLLTVQHRLKSCDFPVWIIISGLDGSGKGEVINLLNEWMDARYLTTAAFSTPSDEERERPRLWRFWRTFPANGTIGIYIGSWYSDPLAWRVNNQINDDHLQVELRRIRQLEQELFDDGGLIIKCWLHLKKKQQSKRLKTLEKNPDTRWRVTEQDKKHLAMYDDFVVIAEHVLAQTSTASSPWLIVEGGDIRYSSLTIGQHILTRIEQRIEQRKNRPPLSHQAAAALPIQIPQRNVLDALDLSLTMAKSVYQEKLEKYQGKLSLLMREMQARKQSVVLVFEGWDAAGKGGTIRRLTAAMDARHYRVIQIAAPTDEERAHHYLWRFWRHISRAGQVTIYDRSWYGRVLVERVEGFANDNEWQRAYSEIVNFEEALLAHGTVVLKFWLHIDKDEQLKRFKERETISYKQYKITEEDYRNREKWDDYLQAVNEMIARTSTHDLPWLLVEANDKYYARIKVLKSCCQHLERILEADA